MRGEVRYVAPKISGNSESQLDPGSGHPSPPHSFANNEPYRSVTFVRSRRLQRGPKTLTSLDIGQAGVQLGNSAWELYV